MEPFYLLIIAGVVASFLIATIIIIFILLRGERANFRLFVESHNKELLNLQISHEKEMKKEMSAWQKRIEDQHYELMGKVEDADERVKKMQSKVRSEQVRMGHLLEKLSPILGTFPVDPRSNDIIPCSGPVDYVGFITDKGNDNGVYFIEVKTGSADLSQKQKIIKSLVEEKRVYFLVHRPDNRMDDFVAQSPQ